MHEKSAHRMMDRLFVYKDSTTPEVISQAKLKCEVCRSGIGINDWLKP